jgi:hypothetical protein
MTDASAARLPASPKRRYDAKIMAMRRNWLCQSAKRMPERVRRAFDAHSTRGKPFEAAKKPFEAAKALFLPPRW